MAGTGHPLLGDRLYNKRTGKAVRESVTGDFFTRAALGRMEYRADKFGVVRMGIGKASMDANKLNENFRAFYDEILRKKPSDLKGEYIKGISVTSTMGVGISIDYKKIKL